MKKAYTCDTTKSVIPRLAPKPGARTWGTRPNRTKFSLTHFTNSLRCSLAAGHAATGLAFVSINRNQESVAVGVGEFVSLDIGAVLERTIHFEAIVVLRSEIFHVL